MGFSREFAYCVSVSNRSVRLNLFVSGSFLSTLSTVSTWRASTDVTRFGTDGMRPKIAVSADAEPPSSAVYGTIQAMQLQMSVASKCTLYCCSCEVTNDIRKTINIGRD